MHYEKGYEQGMEDAHKKFKEYLEKKLEKTMDNPYTGHCCSDMNLLNEIINELFGETTT